MQLDPASGRRRVARAIAACALALAGVVGAEPTVVMPRILNGSPTSGFPEVGVVGIRQQSGRIATCSGTLIAPTVVLTAAHCLVEATEAAAVFFPEQGPRLEMESDRFVVHPEYQGRPFADIGLVFLTSPAGAILPASLPVLRPRGRRGDIVGFGTDGADTTIEKRAGTVKLMRHCPRRARPRVGLRRRELASSLCWKPKAGGNDTCVGDSGGPLFVDGVVAGVHSAGISNSPTGCPSLLSWDTDVARFREWIDAQVRSTSR
jgi:hypothetical protein